MKLNSNTFASWLKSASRDVRFFLIYGYDLGQVKMLNDDLISHFHKCSEEVNLVSIEFDRIRGDLSLIKDELASRSLFGGTKIICITGCAAVISKDFLSILESDKSGSIVIFQAEELRPTSSLRKAFEEMANGVAVACYKDDQASLEKFIRQFFVDRNIQVDNSVPMILASLLPANRLVVRGELEKLLLYKDDHDLAISSEDIEKVIADAADLSFDELCTAYLLKNSKEVQIQLKRVLSQDANFMLIIRVLQKYLYRVFDVLNSLQSGMAHDLAITKLSPPVFFKQKDNLFKVMKATNILEIKAYISDLLELESKCKAGVLEPQLLLINFLTANKAQFVNKSNFNRVVI